MEVLTAFQDPLAPFSKGGCVVIAIRGGRQSGSKDLESGLLVMGNGRLYKTEYIRMLGALESERLKVAALSLFHPTASPLSQEMVFLDCDTVSRGQGDCGSLKEDGANHLVGK